MRPTRLYIVPLLIVTMALGACDNTSSQGPNKAPGTPPVAGNGKPASSPAATPGTAEPDEKSPEARAVEKLPEPARWQGPGISWVPPMEWKQDAGDNKFRIATITRDEGENNIQIKVTQLGPVFGSLLDNINRWAAEVGMPPVADADLDKIVTDFSVDGRTGLLVSLVGPQQTMLVAILKTDDASYFFKMTGADPIVGRNRDTFLKLVQSVKFGAGAGSAAAQP